MGKWGRRYLNLPRQKKFRYGEYQDPLPSYLTNSCAPEARLPSWELDYCKLARVPFAKILASKRYIYCYPSVLNWDASAGEEALQNAKDRYLATINGRLCDNPLPDPDMFIDEIDWNPYMDPELMAELDRQHFDPDKAQDDEKSETVECPQSQNNESTAMNPWEGKQEHSNGTLKKDVWRSGIESWGWQQGSSGSISYGFADSSTCSKKNECLQQDGFGLKHSWRDEKKKTIEFPQPQNNESTVTNPWEGKQEHSNGTLKKDEWRSGNESWDWQQRPSGSIDYGFVDSSTCSKKNVSLQHDGFGLKHNWRNEKNTTSFQKENGNESCVRRDQRNKSYGWREHGNESWNHKAPNYYGDKPENSISQSSNHGYRKRERSFHQSSKYRQF